MKRNVFYLAMIILFFAGVSSFNSKPPRYWIGVADFQNNEVRYMVTYTIRAKDYIVAKNIFDKKNKLDSRISGLPPIKDTYLIAEWHFNNSLTEEILKTKIK